MKSRAAWALPACVLGALAVALLVGAEPASLSRALADPTSLDREVIFQLRAPRALLAFLAGAGLAGAGAALQGTLRNPLAEPYLLGVSGGAALGATGVVVLGLSSATLVGAALMPLSALAGGLLATMAVLALAGASRGRSDRVVLGGVVINTIAAGLVTVGKTLTRDSKTQELLYWLTGYIDLPSKTDLVLLALYVAIGLGLLLYDAPRLDVLVLGRQKAESLGVRPARVEMRVFVAASLLTGAIVSQTGLIGFVGLVVPHASRFVVGPHMRKLLPTAALLGGAFLVLCDGISRLLFRVLHTELPVGAVTALVGGPVFLWLLRRRS